MTDTPMQEAVKRINEARELGEIGVDLFGLEIKEIPRELLELADTLKWLELSNTKVTDISSLANLTKLERLDLFYCPLDKSAANIQTLEKLIENGCEIYGVEEFMK